MLPLVLLALGLFVGVRVARTCSRSRPADDGHPAVAAVAAASVPPAPSPSVAPAAPVLGVVIPLQRATPPAHRRSRHAALRTSA